jgi:hypothetical protein
MRSGIFANGKQVGEWATYDAQGTSRQSHLDDIAGLIDPRAILEAKARPYGRTRAVLKISAAP